MLQGEKRGRELLDLTHVARRQYEQALEHPEACAEFAHKIGIRRHDDWLAGHVRAEQRNQQARGAARVAAAGAVPKP